jgi:hypothetical protein
MKSKGIVFALMVFAASCGAAHADEIPGDCLRSISVREDAIPATIDWILATGANAKMSCGAAELMRQRLFVEGSYLLKESDLSGTPAEAQRKALAAFDDLQKKIRELPGEDVPGTLFSAGGYLVAKYQLAMCILTAAEAGGTCWIAAGTFFYKTGSFFLKLYKNESSKLKKQELLADLNDLRPVIAGLRGGPSDPNGVRNRWVRTQTQLCRAIQQGCR